jgi:hypothetical protein
LKGFGAIRKQGSCLEQEPCLRQASTLDQISLKSQFNFFVCSIGFNGAVEKVDSPCFMQNKISRYRSSVVNPLQISSVLLFHAEK